MKSLENIEKTLRSGGLSQALSMLIQLTNQDLSDHAELRHAIIALVARHKQLVRKRAAGSLSDGEAQITENQIRFSTLDMIDLLKDEESLKGIGDFLPPPLVGPELREKSRILFFAANPEGSAHLRLNEEIREVETKLALASLTGRFELISARATRPEDFLTMILKHRPEFVHFSGHGSASGIYMLDDEDEAVLFSKDRLAEVFRLFHEVVACVVLNACFSLRQSEQIKDYIPNVIGTTHRVGDAAAIKFASLFYTAIGEGNEIPFAFEFARLGAGFANEEESVAEDEELFGML